ncbi:unnamed protein product [Urochloa decumbens]|uniref:Gnk2-homologous domain-containing protein n=1 Tax=Urochloa decumbens TaxID=240449 RepID=A0ABC8YH02_9POAL
MASPTKLSGGGLPSLIVLVLVLLQLQPGSALKLKPASTSTSFPPLVDCAPAPAPAAPSSNNDTAAFRANVVSLLGTLPSAAAAGPTGFVATLDAGTGRDRAFARGACFGLGAPGPGGPSPGDCVECLSAAAHDVAGGCGAATRRAGVWRAGCFLSYADTNASTAREDAFRGWFYDDSDGAGGALRSQQCTAAECSRCLDESVSMVPALVGARLSRVHADAVVVVGYACYLRVPLFAPEPRWEQYYFFGFIDVLGVLLLGYIKFCIREARDPA